MTKQASKQPRKPNAHLLSVMEAGRDGREGAADVINVAWDGIEQADWEESRATRAVNQLVRMIKATFTRDKDREHKRRLLLEHGKGNLPKALVKRINDEDRAYDLKAAAKANAPKAKPTSKEIALAAQDDDSDADNPVVARPDRPAIAAVVRRARKAEQTGIVEEGTARRTLTLGKARAAA